MSFYGLQPLFLLACTWFYYCLLYRFVTATPTGARMLTHSLVGSLFLAKGEFLRNDNRVPSERRRTVGTEGWSDEEENK